MSNLPNQPIAEHKLPSMRGVRVLITGGLGFVGSNLAHQCVQLGAEVTIYDCLDERSGGNIHNVDDIRDDVRIIQDDTRNFEGVGSAIPNQNILFNCAAYTSHPNSMREPLIDVDVNCKGVINVLEAARRFNPQIKIVHVGTSTQIGRMLHSPVTEEHPEFPVDIYSANKSASEKYVLIYGRAYNMKVTVVRLANIFGPRSNIKSSDFGFINYFIGLALRGLELTVYGDGSQLRNVMYVEDCVAALVLAAMSEQSNNQVFFAAGDRQYSVAEIARGITEQVGGAVKFVEWPDDRKAIEIGDAIISNEKIKSVLKWSPRWELNDGFAKTRAYFTERLNHYID